MGIQDEALAVRVREALMQDKRISGQAMAVRVAQGEVFLKGVVDTLEQKELAQMVARGIAGVRYINVLELSVRESPEPMEPQSAESSESTESSP